MAEQARKLTSDHKRAMAEMKDDLLDQSSALGAGDYGITEWRQTPAEWDHLVKETLHEWFKIKSKLQYGGLRPGQEGAIEVIQLVDGMFMPALLQLQHIASAFSDDLGDETQAEPISIMRSHST
jgi:hypothetical protein